MHQCWQPGTVQDYYDIAKANVAVLLTQLRDTTTTHDMFE